MPSIESVRTSNTPFEEVQEAHTSATGGAAPPEKNNAVQTFKRPEGENTAVGDDSKLESFFREHFAELGPKQSYEIDGKLDATDGISGQFRGKLKVERKSDGSFTVKTDESAALGIGARILGKARATVAAGTTFHVKNAAEAADLCDALVKSTAVGSLPGGQVFSDLRDFAHDTLGVRGDMMDAGARLRSYEGRAAEVRFEAGIKTELGDKVKEEFAGVGTEAALKASLKGTGEVSIDRERGEVHIARKIELAGQMKAELPLHNVGEAEAKASVTVTTSLQMPPAVREAFARGEISIADAVSQTMQHPAHISYAAEGEVEFKGRLELMAPNTEGKAVLKTELELTAAQSSDPRELIRLMAEAKYSVELDGAIGAKASYDFGAGEAELSVTKHVRTQPYGGELFSLEGAVKRGATELEATNPVALDARRATANLR